MKTLTRTLLLAALTAASGLFAACSSDKNEDPAPADPTPAFKLGHYFDFTTVAPGGGTAHSGYGTTHPGRDITGEASLAPSVLVLDFKANTDNAHFEIDRPKLAANWLGTYALRSRSQLSAPVFTSYVYSLNGGSSIYRFSDTTSDLTGNVTVTAYDAKRQLVSGTYEVRAAEQFEPGKTPSFNDPKCTIILAGDFENLKVKAL